MGYLQHLLVETNSTVRALPLKWEHLRHWRTCTPRTASVGFKRL